VATSIGSRRASSDRFPGGIATANGPSRRPSAMAGRLRMDKNLKPHASRKDATDIQIGNSRNRRRQGYVGQERAQRTQRITANEREWTRIDPPTPSLPPSLKLWRAGCRFTQIRSAYNTVAWRRRDLSDGLCRLIRTGLPACQLLNKGSWRTIYFADGDCLAAWTSALAKWSMSLSTRKVVTASFNAC
jgi:hypothetical protein